MRSKERTVRASVLHRGEGFPGQRILVLPKRVIAEAATNPLLRGLFATDAGWFPRANGHFRNRAEGIDAAILIYCVNGRGWCEMAGKQFAVNEGELLVIPPHQPHAYGADESSPWTIAWAHVSGAQLPALLEHLGTSANSPAIYLGEDQQLLSLFDQLLDTLERGYAPHYLLYASQTLTHLVGAMIWRQRQVWRDSPDLKQRITQSITYMKEHLDQPLRVPRLAALANLSSSHYTAVFRQHTGYAPLDYFIRLRMHRACQLLDTTDLPIKHIAQQLGYEDALYFSRVFHQVNEVSPRQYRSLHKG